LKTKPLYSTPMNKTLKLFVFTLAIIALWASCTPPEQLVHVTGISLDKTELTMTEGEETTLTVTIAPDNATDKSITWTSINETVATVSAEGLVKALKAGSATIKVITADGKFTASCIVTVNAPMGVITGEATHISCQSAMLSGKISPQTSDENLKFGVLYSTSSEVLPDSSVEIEAESFDAEYNYSVYTDVLEPETTYYYRSYISKQGEVKYGEIKSFKTLAVSSMIETQDATDIHPQSAVMHAFLDLTDSRYNSLEYGFEITAYEGAGYTYAVKANNYSETGKKFSYNDQSLSRDTKYSFAAYVKLDDIIHKGETKTFTTPSITASVTAEASNILYYSATISGDFTVTSQGIFNKAVTLYYSTAANTLEDLISNGLQVIATLNYDNTYSIDLTSLKESTAYYYVVVANVDQVEFYTEVKSFTTKTINASVSADTSNVLYYTATISGKLTVTSEGEFTKSAILYYSSTANSLEALKNNGTKNTLTLNSDGTYSIFLTSLKDFSTYAYAVVAKVDEKEFSSTVKILKTKEEFFESVALGLSVRWANMNVEAYKSWEYGGHYAWGETSAKSDFNWGNYTLCSGTYQTMTKYCTSSDYGTVDNKTTLELVDDVARVKLGGDWRMPTAAEWEELLNKDNCTWTWVEEYSDAKIRGYIVQSKKERFTDKFIFLPAAGYITDTNHFDRGTNGFYWTSSLNTELPYLAVRFHFYYMDIKRWNYIRYSGNSVRAVKK